MMSEKSRIMKIFWVGSRMCVVIKIMHLSSYLNGYHNGYVESKFKFGYDPYDCVNEEATFAGELGDIEGKWFIGFDTVHIRDCDTNQTLESVIERTKIFAQDIIVMEDAMNE